MSVPSCPRVLRPAAAAALLTLAGALLGGCSLFRSSAPPKVRDLGWLSGHWVGEYDGQRIELDWTEPVAGLMDGVHRAYRDGDVVLAANMRILGGINGVALYGSPHGEESRIYNLVERDGRYLRFLGNRREFPAEGVFERHGDRLQVTFRGLDRVGDMRTVVFEYRRADG